jgi:hypothetical protein
MAEEEGPDNENALVRATPLFITEQEYELFQQEGIEVFRKYDLKDEEGNDVSIDVLHFYPYFLGMKETIQDLLQKNHALFHMINNLNNMLMIANTKIATLTQDVEELKSKRIIH